MNTLTPDCSYLFKRNRELEEENSNFHWSLIRTIESLLQSEQEEYKLTRPLIVSSYLTPNEHHQITHLFKIAGVWCIKEGIRIHDIQRNNLVYIIERIEEKSYRQWYKKLKTKRQQS